MSQFSVVNGIYYTCLIIFISLIITLAALRIGYLKLTRMLRVTS